MDIRRATQKDTQAMWAIFEQVIATGDTLPFFDTMDRETFCAQWLGETQTSYVASPDVAILGMYKVGANYPDLGSHVASATYVVAPSAQGKGIGRALVEHSIAAARESGFLGMQFNYVVSTNTAAVSLYEKLGFAIVGTLPRAFRHQERGLVDTYVMHRFL